MVTGGAGYIGAHVARELQSVGLSVVVLDNLSTGVRGFVPADVPFIEADLLDTAAVRKALALHSVTGVIHIAGFKFAGISVEKPLHTYEQNVTAMMSLLKAMEAEGVSKIVFSSS